MAGKVNKKFVMVLSAIILVVVGGVFGLMYFFLYNTGADLARMGDKKMAEKEYKDAAEIYSKAVFKEKTNTEFLSKWIDALEHTTPESQRKYSEAFLGQLMAARRQLALVDNDLKMQREYLDLRQSLSDSLPFERSGYDTIIDDTTAILLRHPEKTPETQGLRRYRGLSRLRIAANIRDTADETYVGAREDLEAAMEANPADEEAALGLSTWYLVKADRATGADAEKEVTQALADSRRIITDFAQKNPDSILAAATILRKDLDSSIRELVSRFTRPTPEETEQITRAYQAATKPKLDALAAVGMKDPSKITVRSLIMLRDLESIADPQANASRTESLLRAAIAATPDDSEFIMMLADVIARRGDNPGAIATYQRLIDQPIPPLSTPGYLLFSRRNDAMFRQSQSIFQTWQASKDEAARAAAEQQIKSLRERLVAVEDATVPAILLIDAELGLMSGDLAAADRMLAKFNEATKNQSAEGLLLAADVSSRRNELGGAKEHLEALVAAQPTNLLGVLRLAQVEQALTNYARAKSLYERLAIAQPENKFVQEQLQVVRGLSEGGKVDDPVLQIIIDAEQLTKDLERAKDPDAAVKVAAKLRADIAASRSTDPRLVRARALAEIRANNKAGAIEAVERGLVDNPDSKELQVLKTGLTEDDPLTARLQVADVRAGDNELERALMRSSVLNDYGKEAEAAAELDKAKKLAPKDPRVIELDFVRTVEKKDWARAEELLQVAQREDVDHANGDTLRARMEAAKGNGKEAVRIMEQAVARGGTQPEAWRLLGHLQNNIGRASDAVTSFAEGLKRRPNDVMLIKDLLRAQINLRRTDDALNTARTRSQYAESDPDFVEMWLKLEAAIGDRAMVADRRARLYKLNPDDSGNALELAAIYMDTDRRADARPMIDRLRKNSDSLAAANLDAGWYWAANEPAKAKQIFEDFLASSDAAKSEVRNYAAYAQFLLQRQDFADGMAVLERARAYQNPKNAEVDRILSDTYFNMGRFQDTIDASKRILDAGADTPEKLYAKRRIESLIALKKFEEADSLIKPLAAAPDADAITKLLEADVRKGLGDTRGQRAVLDEAVARFPNETNVFLRRGQAMLESADDKASWRDAVADFTKALQLTPNSWQALRLRADAYEKLQDNDARFADLRAALDANPNDNELIGGLLSFLLNNNRDAEAVEVANRVLDRRPRDASAFLGISQIFSGAGRWDQAIRYIDRAYTIDDQDAIAQRYLDTLLSAKPPGTAAAEQLLARSPIKEHIASNPSFLMAQARMQLQQNKSAAALRSARDAIALIDVQNARMMGAWFTEARRMLPDPKELRPFMDQLMQGNAATEWLAFFRASLMMEDASTHEPAIAILRELLQRSTNKPLRQLAFRALGGSLYNFNRFEEAAAVMRQTLVEFPDDTESMNNLAYTLAKRLHKPEEALPIAEKVAAARPESGDVLDTLAMCYLLTGRNAEALTELQKAAKTQMNPSAAVSVGMHQAEALWALDRKDEARTLLAGVTKIAAANAGAMSAQTKTDLEDVTKRIGTP